VTPVRRLLLAFTLCSAAGAARAEPPLIRAIEFRGNEITQPRVMLREMVVQVGDRAHPQRIERSRQAILDLGLFRSVDVEQTPAEDGVHLTFVVREKWYVLPLPRLEASSDREFGYGLQMRWDNVWGLNHSASAVGIRRELKESDREAQSSFSASYFWPFVADTPYSLSLFGAHVAQDSLHQGQPFGETINVAQALVRRRYADGPASQGWTVGGGLLWRNQDTSGGFAPPRDGRSTAAVGTLSYRDLRFRVYSEEGHVFSSRYEIAGDGLFSDFGYSQLTGGYARFWPLGETPHQTVHVRASAGTFHGGPSRRRNRFSLGGSSTLRGYRNDFAEGNFFYYISGEYLHPVHWKWLRALALVEMGSARRDVHGRDLRDAYLSVGLGARLRFTWFVNFEFETGVAWPLVEGGGARLFAGAV
jgi:outer membrane protein assembly factor BamA